MNIFALDKSPELAAEYHCDKHSIKMILEYTQLLSTAHRVLDGTPVVEKSASNRNVTRWKLDGKADALIYSATHVNHPSAIWCRDNISNYWWLCDLLTFLCAEYSYRYGRTHKCETIGIVDYLTTNAPKNISRDSSRFTFPTPAMPDDAKIEGDSIASYRNYYMMYKQRMLEWKNREVPEWLNLTKEETV